MTTSRLFRRSVAVLAGTGAAAALALVPAGSANAAVQAQFAAEATASASYTGSVSGATCDLTSAPGSDSTESAIKTLTKSGTRQAATTINATFTNSADASDQVRVKGNYSSKIVVKKHKKDLASMTLTGSGKLSVTNSLSFGSDCAGSGVGAGFTSIAFTEHKAGNLVLTRATAKSALSIIVVVNAKTGHLVVFDYFQGDQSHAVSKAKIKPGQYIVEEAASGITVGNAGIFLKQGSAPKSVSLKTGLNLTFTPSK